MWPSILLVVFTCLIVYPLSVGPAEALNNRTDSVQLRQAIVTLYAPLLFACKRFPLLRDVVFAYSEYW